MVAYDCCFPALVSNTCCSTIRSFLLHARESFETYAYLETSSGQSSNLYLNVVHFFNTSVNYTSVAA